MLPRSKDDEDGDVVRISRGLNLILFGRDEGRPEFVRKIALDAAFEQYFRVNSKPSLGGVSVHVSDADAKDNKYDEPSLYEISPALMALLDMEFDHGHRATIKREDAMKIIYRVHVNKNGF